MGKPKTLKTENDLDERFQWREGLDPNHIFDGEKQMIKELRGKIPQLKMETDKFVAVFLFARRHNMEETAALLHKFFKAKEEYSSLFEGQHVPSFMFNNLAELVLKGGGSVIQPNGYRDNKGRMLRYFMMGRDTPAGRTLNETYAVFFWQTYYSIATEPLNVWRNGMCIVVDLDGAGLRNLDISSKGRETTRAMQGTFPFRIRAMLVVNGGFVLSALVTAAKLVLPKKLIERLRFMNVDELQNHIPSEYLLPQFGGAAPEFGFEEFNKEINRLEDQLYSKGIWTYPDGATLAASP